MTKGRILIVDDDESTRRFLAALLTALGHEGACAESGEEALRRLREHKGLLNKLKKWKVEPASKEWATGNKWAAPSHYCVANTLPRFPGAY